MYFGTEPHCSWNDGKCLNFIVKERLCIKLAGGASARLLGSSLQHHPYTHEGSYVSHIFSLLLFF